MRFKMYVPYSQMEVNIIETLGHSINYFYPTLDELIEEHGPHEKGEYCVMWMKGVEIDIAFDENDESYQWLGFDDICES